MDVAIFSDLALIPPQNHQWISTRFDMNFVKKKDCHNYYNFSRGLTIFKNIVTNSF